MRTAEEILSDIYECTTDGEDLQTEITLNPSIWIISKAINEARKEAIEECSKIPILKHGDIRAINIKAGIIRLINELK